MRIYKNIVKKSQILLKRCCETEMVLDQYLINSNNVNDTVQLHKISDLKRSEKRIRIWTIFIHKETEQKLSTRNLSSLNVRLLAKWNILSQFGAMANDSNNPACAAGQLFEEKDISKSRDVYKK